MGFYLVDGRNWVNSGHTGFQIRGPHYGPMVWMIDLAAHGDHVTNIRGLAKKGMDL